MENIDTTFQRAVARGQSNGMMLAGLGLGFVVAAVWGGWLVYQHQQMSAAEQRANINNYRMGIVLLVIALGIAAYAWSAYADAL